MIDRWALEQGIGQTVRHFPDKLELGNIIWQLLRPITSLVFRRSDHTEFQILIEFPVEFIIQPAQEWQCQSCDRSHLVCKVSMHSPMWSPIVLGIDCNAHSEASTRELHSKACANSVYMHNSYLTFTQIVPLKQQIGSGYVHVCPLIYRRQQEKTGPEVWVICNATQALPCLQDKNSVRPKTMAAKHTCTHRAYSLSDKCIISVEICNWFVVYC